MSWSTQSERILVVQAQARDPAAFGELVTRYERRLAYYIRRMMELAEIAKVIGCSLGTAKSRLHYAKRSLRLAIEGTGND